MSLAYVICTSPRSGSTLLCEGLATTGRAGTPAEFFDHREMVAGYWTKRYGISQRAAFVDTIVEATSTPNGVFGTKLHWTTHAAMHRAFSDALAERIPDARQRSLDELLRAAFSAVRYVWLRRENKVAQGISHFRATRSDFWQIPKDAGTKNDAAAIAFSFRGIDSTIGWAYEYDRLWQRYFEHHALTPLELFYEDVAASYDACIRNVLAFIDVPCDGLPEIQPSLERMADATSVEWERRYRELVAANAVQLR